MGSGVTAQRARVEEDRMRRRMDAFWRPGLYDVLCKLKGKELGGWRVESLLAAGGQGVVMRVRRQALVGVMKMPLVGYDRPVSFGSRQVRRLRQGLEREARMLALHSGTLLPGLIELATGENPLLEGRSARLQGSERFLVMEAVEGLALDAACVSSAPDGRRMARWAGELLGFVHRLRSHQHFYTDFKPNNIIVRPDGGLSLVDAGGICVLGQDEAVEVTPGFGQVPEVLEAGALEALSLMALGRAFYAALSGRMLYQGVALEASALSSTNEPWRRWVMRLSLGELNTVEEARAALAF